MHDLEGWRYGLDVGFGCVRTSCGVLWTGGQEGREGDAWVGGGDGTCGLLINMRSWSLTRGSTGVTCGLWSRVMNGFVMYK